MRGGDGRGEAPGNRAWPFLAGLLAGGAGAILAYSLAPRRGLDTRLIRASRDDRRVPPVVVVPGILGSQLHHPNGTQAWLNLGNALGHHALSLPFRLPLSASRDDLLPGGLLGADTVLPRVFGFTEYADLVDLLEEAGFRPANRQGLAFHIFSYDWRRDLVESARALHETLETLAEGKSEDEDRFSVIGHSMGGLVARYYLRYGTAEPDGPVTWAGARRIRNLVLIAVPNAGSVPALDAILNGNRVGLSYTTLAAAVIARMPSIYQLLPPAGAPALLDHLSRPLDVDLHDVAAWERFGWGPFGGNPGRRRGDKKAVDPDPEAHRAFLAVALARARAVHRALSRPPEAPCPARVVLLGGDCLPTLARALVPEPRGTPPRFEPATHKEADAMFEAGDGRVTRASVLAAHLPGADEAESGSGLAEVSHAIFGSAEHHGIYREPTFQSILLRLLLRPIRSAVR